MVFFALAPSTFSVRCRLDGARMGANVIVVDLQRASQLTVTPTALRSHGCRPKVHLEHRLASDRQREANSRLWSNQGSSNGAPSLSQRQKNRTPGLERCQLREVP